MTPYSLPNEKNEATPESPIPITPATLAGLSGTAPTRKSSCFNHQGCQGGFSLSVSFWHCLLHLGLVRVTGRAFVTGTHPPREKGKSKDLAVLLSLLGDGLGLSLSSERGGQLSTEIHIDTGDINLNSSSNSLRILPSA